MPAIEELQYLNYVLESKDWDVVSQQGLTEEHFPVFKNVFNFIYDFYKINKVTPTMETVLSKFEEFEQVEPEKLDVVVEALKEDYLHRQFKPILKQAAEMIAQKRTVDAIQTLKTESTNILKQLGSQSKGYSYIGMAEQRKEKYLAIHGRSKDDIQGFTTGFKPLDLATNGLVAGGEETDYFLVFAPSNMGKTLITSFISMSAWNSTLDWDYPAYFALEQRAEEIARNWDNVLAGVSNLALQRGTLTNEEKDRYIDFLDRLKQKKKDMVIYDLERNGGRSYTVQEIQRILETEGHNRFALDQLSKVRLSNSIIRHSDLRQRLVDVSAEVRGMILSTGIPGYIVAQATRDSARRVKKRLEEEEIQGEDIGEAYAIFQDASKGISIVKIDNNTFKIQVIKNRGNASGQTFLVRYNFDTGIVSVLNGELKEQYF